MYTRLYVSVGGTPVQQNTYAERFGHLNEPCRIVDAPAGSYGRGLVRIALSHILQSSKSNIPNAVLLGVDRQDLALLVESFSPRRLVVRDLDVTPASLAIQPERSRKELVGR